MCILSLSQPTMGRLGCRRRGHLSPLASPSAPCFMPTAGLVEHAGVSHCKESRRRIVEDVGPFRPVLVRVHGSAVLRLSPPVSRQRAPPSAPCPTARGSCPAAKVVGIVRDGPKHERPPPMPPAMASSHAADKRRAAWCRQAHTEGDGHERTDGAHRGQAPFASSIRLVPAGRMTHWRSLELLRS